MRRQRQSHLTLGQQPRRHRPDYWLLILTAILLAIGLVVVYAISPALSAQSNASSNYYVNKELLAIGLGAGAFGVVAAIPVSIWQRLKVPLLVAAAGATLLALALPVSSLYPAHRWIRVAGFSLQSVEVIKFAFLIWFAAWLAKAIAGDKIQHSGAVLKTLIVALGIIGVVVAFLQKDLGSASVIVVMAGSMCFVAGLPMKRILAIAGLLAVGAVLVILPFSYRRDRLLNFLHPASNCQSTGYQACQALISVGSGGVIGLGLGNGIQAYGYQPEAANDSIFAIYAEEFGFAGCALLLIAFAALFARLKSIAERAPDDFSRLLIVGILAWFSIQALINIGGMVGLLPLKGITLPFISYGGTSVVFVMAAVGLAFRISHYTLYTVPSSQLAEGKRYEDRSSRRRLGGAHHSVASTRSRT